MSFFFLLFICCRTFSVSLAPSFPQVVDGVSAERRRRNDELDGLLIRVRKHLIVKGRSRDTAWFRINDDEWPAVHNGFLAWLDEANFDLVGKQKRSLEECRVSARAANGNH